MLNVQMEVEDETLTITIDLSERHGPSASGKTTKVASTEGNRPIPGHENLRIGLNVYEKK